MAEYVKLRVDEIAREMATAFLLTISGESVWMPRSQVHKPQHYHAGQHDLHMAVTVDVVAQKQLLLYQ